MPLKRSPQLRFDCLEDRINCAIVTSTMDFPLDDYDPTLPSTWKPGALRYELIKAMEPGGTPITFNTDPAFGVDFDDPANQ